MISPINNIDIEIINCKTMNLYIPNEKDSKLFKYEIYGNKNFYLYGSLEVSNPDNISISFGIPNDDLFFIKIIVLNNCNKISNIYTRFYNHIPLNLTRNLSMNILKKKPINEKKIKVLYDNVTSDEEDSENDSNSDSNSNKSDCENKSDCCNSDSEINLDNSKSELSNEEDNDSIEEDNNSIQEDNLSNDSETIFRSEITE